MAIKSIILRNVRLAYPRIFEPETFDGKTFYSAVVCIPKEDNIDALKAVAKQVATEKWGDQPPRGLKNPIKDGDHEEARPEFNGFWYIKAKSKNPPGIVNGRNERITDSTAVRSGDVCNVELAASVYDLQTSKGVNFYLNNIQWVSEGEPIGSGGGRRPEDVFEQIETAGSPSESGDSNSFFS